MNVASITRSCWSILFSLLTMHHPRQQRPPCKHSCLLKLTCRPLRDYRRDRTHRNLPALRVASLVVCHNINKRSRGCVGGARWHTPLAAQLIESHALHPSCSRSQPRAVGFGAKLWRSLRSYQLESLHSAIPPIEIKQDCEINGERVHYLCRCSPYLWVTEYHARRAIG